MGNLTRIRLKISPISCRKTAIDKNLRKTGGSSKDSYSLGSFWDVKTPVIPAALPGIFFSAQKCTNFDDVFQLIVGLSFSKILSEIENGQNDFIL